MEIRALTFSKNIPNACMSLALLAIDVDSLTMEVEAIMNQKIESLFIASLCTSQLIVSVRKGKSNEI